MIAPPPLEARASNSSELTGPSAPTTSTSTIAHAAARAAAQHRIRRRWSTAVAVLGALAANSVLAVTAPDFDWSPRYLLASAMLWLSVYPSWRYFADRERHIPFVPLVSVVYFCAYGLPAFNLALEIRGKPMQPQFVDEALALAVVGELLLFVAFYGARMAWMPRLRLPLDLARHANRLLVLGWLMLGLRLVVARVTLSPSLAQPVAFALSVPAVIAAALSMLVLRGRLGALQRVALGGLLAVTLVLDFATAAVAQPLMTLVMIFFVYVAERGRLPIAALVASTLLIVASLGTKHEFRRVITREHGMDTVDRIDVFSRLIVGLLSRGPTELDKARNVAENRIDHLGAFAYVIRQTPASVPYWDGATYADFAWSFVPRLLVPDKPLKTLGQEYGHRYSFINGNDRRTSINLEQTVEMYANFGVAGVLVGMLLLGLLYRSLYAALNHGEGGDGAVLVAALVFRILLNIESDFSLVFGGILQQGACLALLLYVVAAPRAPAWRR